ncbi:hypothetical protein BDR05DRAFT_971540 [Suillus weaverae]|nr:hypothetical protein BDR05DRAFT_971540 [Suillus weaverae]
MRYKWLGLKTKHEDIIFNPEDIFRVYSGSERQKYNKLHKKIRIVVDFSENTTTEQAEPSVSSDESLELRPTTSEIFRKCPR